MYFETSRLILRKPETTDIDEYLEFVNSEFVQRYNAMTPVTREKAEAEFSSAAEDLSTIAVELKATGKIIGIISIQEDSIRYGVESREISYLLRESEARKGYMKEALSTLEWASLRLVSYLLLTAFASMMANLLTMML